MSTPAKPYKISPPDYATLWLARDVTERTTGELAGRVAGAHKGHMWACRLCGIENQVCYRLLSESAEALWEHWVAEHRGRR